MADKTKKAAELGPDNNKDYQRLVAEEASVSAFLARAGREVVGSPIAAVLIYAEELQNQQLVSQQAIEARDTRIAELETTVAQNQGGFDLLKAAIVDNELPIGPTESVIEGAARLLSEKPPEPGKATDEVTNLRTANAQLASEVSRLEAQVAELKGEAVEAEAPAPRERPTAARDIGPAYNPEPEPARKSKKQGKELIDELNAEGTALLALIAEQGAELVLSNGEYEIVDFEPVRLTAADVAFTSGRIRVTKTIEIKGPGQREAIHGAGLVIGDKQARYCAFPSPIAIEPGQQRGFTNAFTF